MRKIPLTLAFLAMLAICLSGCERNRVSKEANQLSAAYEYKMDKGQTTPDQDKQFIKAISKVSLQLDSSIRGTSRAQGDRENAIKAAIGAVNLDK